MSEREFTKAHTKSDPATRPLVGALSIGTEAGTVLLQTSKRPFFLSLFFFPFSWRQGFISIPQEFSNLTD